jgi:hypothetical protein
VEAAALAADVTAEGNDAVWTTTEVVGITAGGGVAAIVGVDGVDDEVVGISDVDGVADEEVVTGGSEETLRLTVVIGSAGG